MDHSEYGNIIEKNLSEDAIISQGLLRDRTESYSFVYNIGSPRTNLTSLSTQKDWKRIWIETDKVRIEGLLTKQFEDFLKSPSRTSAKTVSLGEYEMEELKKSTDLIYRGVIEIGSDLKHLTNDVSDLKSDLKKLTTETIPEMNVAIGSIKTDFTWIKWIIATLALPILLAVLPYALAFIKSL